MHGYQNQTCIVGASLLQLLGSSCVKFLSFTTKINDDGNTDD